MSIGLCVCACVFAKLYVYVCVDLFCEFILLSVLNPAVLQPPTVLSPS